MIQGKISRLNSAGGTEGVSTTKELHKPIQRVNSSNCWAEKCRASGRMTSAWFSQHATTVNFHLYGMYVNS